MPLTGKDAAEFVARVDAEARRLYDDQLATAKRDALLRGKEPFDLALLETMCDTSNQGRPVPLPERMKHHEYAYYVTFPVVMTLAEYAKVVDELQRW